MPDHRSDQTAPTADQEAKRIYIAGPMRGYPDFNAPAFRDAAKRLRAAGHEVFCPTERDDAHGFTPDGMAFTGTEAELDEAGFDLRRALCDDLVWITRHADAVVVLPGWEDSRGATAEAATARALNLPVRELDPFLAQHEPLNPERGQCACGGPLDEDGFCPQEESWA